MKQKSDKIIVSASTFIFVFVGSYLASLVYGEIIAGTSVSQLIDSGVMLIGVMGISLFSTILMINSFRSPRHNMKRYGT